MRQTDPAFYKGKKWQRERKLYAQAHPFCERCLMLGSYKPTEIVHHREYLNTEKSKDARISLNFENLEALCYECHNKEHHTGAERSKKKRYYFDEKGLVIKDDSITESDNPAAKARTSL